MTGVADPGRDRAVGALLTEFVDQPIVAGVTEVGDFFSQPGGTGNRQTIDRDALRSPRQQLRFAGAMSVVAAGTIPFVSRCMHEWFGQLKVRVVVATFAERAGRRSQ